MGVQESTVGQGAARWCPGPMDLARDHGVDLGLASWPGPAMNVAAQLVWPEQKPSSTGLAVAPLEASGSDLLALENSRTESADPM